MALLRIQSCKAEAGYRSNSTIYALIRDGLWTKPVRLGKRSVGWPDNEVKAVCAARIAGKSDTAIKELVMFLHSKRSVGLDEVLSENPNQALLAKCLDPVILALQDPSVPSVQIRPIKSGGVA